MGNTIFGDATIFAKGHPIGSVKKGVLIDTAKEAQQMAEYIAADFASHPQSLIQIPTSQAQQLKDRFELFYDESIVKGSIGQAKDDVSQTLWLAKDLYEDHSPEDQGMVSVTINARDLFMNIYPTERTPKRGITASTLQAIESAEGHIIFEFSNYTEHSIEAYPAHIAWKNTRGRFDQAVVRYALRGTEQLKKLIRHHGADWVLPKSLCIEGIGTRPIACLRLAPELISGLEDGRPVASTVVREGDLCSTSWDHQESGDAE